ncbi:MAG: M20 family metallo-hydrolase, partial [Candidatus Eremiobacteraeota bacterium]|nr:M20 family metallo-hydrolase [Candidatus Eremiobacteraeota bacterium]
LFARREGRERDAPPILVGSHLDTVKTGGAYDGAYGVVGAMCALDRLSQDRVEMQHPVVAVAWVGEEGSRFPLGCLGSSVFAGITTAADALALCDERGLSLRDALASGEGARLPDVPAYAERRVAAYLELHIEQGPTLEDAGARLGLVTAIVGQRRLRVDVIGRSGHAGTVPMAGRSDALCAAAELILALEDEAKRQGEAVVTVGRITVEPGGTNVIPAKATFTIDVRSPDDSKIETILVRLREEVGHVSLRRGVQVKTTVLEARKPTPMDASLRAALERAVANLGQRTVELPSGAGHDAMCLATIAPAAMLFVPSIGGHSHVGEERTSEADLLLGLDALVASIVEVDRVLEGR